MVKPTWKKTKYKDGSFVLKNMQAYIYVHKTMSRYWIDYGIKNRNVMSTMMAKNQAELAKKIALAKKSFVWVND